ncbi:MAG: hypothetical protein A3C88_02330 [Candidatus Yanofskybacteria bacterium RIFCSPHIGHO2_02_FULL_50_12]|uniref:Uncharacterized protein n=1 Tax=Candidatus Yanofskybacteria bacterium RIFCSPHIGHO2_02_FULL_50_12 TaxID=1802685 RepID=A0A1F8FUD8_9BACT|nr:MAG: hypothetical protein A3C88_02330 [Candidatus Yanofskybacteria bacterium RIFCSPHIGHO2_02_FULL_50_12]
MKRSIAEVRILIEVGTENVSYKVESQTRKGRVDGVLGAGTFDNIRERVEKTVSEELNGVIKRLARQAKYRDFTNRKSRKAR